MRGGGSLESFLAFNNEVLVREITNLPYPVIAAIGHDKDVPLLALAADKMVSTPTAAANLLNQSWQEAQLQLKEREREIFSLFSSVLMDLEYEMNNIFMSIRQKLESVLNAFKMMEYRIKQIIPKMLEARMNEIKNNIETMGRIIDQNDPRRNLKLGYCIAKREGRVIKKTSDAKVGEDVDLQVYDGIIITNVKKIKK